MTQLFTNNAASVLAAGITAIATSMSVATGEGAKFPSPTNGDFVLLTLYQMSGLIETNHEIIKVTTRAGDVLTIVRAQEGTTARAFNAADPVQLRSTAGTLNNMVQQSTGTDHNYFVNGGMEIDQLSEGAAQTFTAGAALAYCVDQWYGACTGANVSGQQVAGSGPTRKRYQFTGAASVTGIQFGQRIEQVDVYDLGGSTATLSVDLANSLLTSVRWQAFYANTGNTFGTIAAPTRTLIASGTFTVNATVTRYSVPIAIPVGATTGIEVVFDVNAQTSGIWTIGNAKLQPGSVPTSYKQRKFGQDLALCERYCQKSYASGTVPGTITTVGTVSALSSNAATGDCIIAFPLRVDMFAPPTVVIYNPNNGSSGQIYDTNGANRAALSGYSAMSQGNKMAFALNSVNSSINSYHTAHFFVTARIP